MKIVRIIHESSSVNGGVENVSQVFNMEHVAKFSIASGKLHVDTVGGSTVAIKIDDAVREEVIDCFTHVMLSKDFDGWYVLHLGEGVRFCQAKKCGDAYRIEEIANKSVSKK